MEYKFRCECEQDYNSLMELLSSQPMNTKVEKVKNHPDIIVIFESDLSLDELRNIMKCVNDGHVMVQTVALTNDYTGERDYDL